MRMKCLLLPLLRSEWLHRARIDRSQPRMFSWMCVFKEAQIERSLIMEEMTYRLAAGKPISEELLAGLSAIKIKYLIGGYKLIRTHIPNSYVYS